MGFEYYYESLLNSGCSYEEAMDEVELHAHDCLREFIKQDRYGDYW